MKTHRTLSIALTMASASLVGLAPHQVQAQDIQEAVPLGIQAMEAQEWEKAHGIFKKLVETYGERGKNLFGGKFGRIYHFKGFCELKLAAKLNRLGGDDNLDKAMDYYEMAKVSYTECYKLPSDDRGTNPFHKKSLLYKGQACQGGEEYKEAINAYKKFLAEREERDKYNPGMFNINMAICHFKLETPQLKQGITYFETALKNKDRWKTPDAAIVSAFQALTKAVIQAKNERALVDFLNQNRSAITLKPYQMVQFGPFFQKLATEALEADMQEAAYNLFALIPGTQVAMSDLQVLKEKLALYPRPGLKDGTALIYKDQIDKWYSELKTKDRSGDPPEVLALTALAFTHESNGNTRGAFGAYEQLELYFGKSRRREENLYNLVRTSSVISEVFITEKYGQIFLKNFPQSDYCESVRSMMLSSLFASGEYEKCEAVAEKMIGELPKPSLQHDVCLHVLGGSKFYLGKFVEAHPFLEEHLKMYEDSQFRLAASYFEASNLSQLQMWAQAAVKLDAFLKKYPDPAENMFLPFALYDRANVHFSESEYEPALVHLNRIETEFPGSNIEDAAYNLKGNILQSQGQRDQAKDYYLKALELAEHRDNPMIAGESLYYLVALLGAEKIDKEPNPNMKDALPYYDKFWKEHQDSPYKAQVAVAGTPALIEAGRYEEAQSNLQGVIAEMAKSENPAGLEGAIGSYTKYYLQGLKKQGLDAGAAADKLKDHYYTFPGIDSKDIRTLAMLRIAVIGVYEDSLKSAQKEKDEALISRNQARINTAFKDLKSDARFEPAKLSNFVLVRIGDYLRTKTSAPRQALPYYQERLKRPQQQGRSKAEFGVADIYGLAGSKSEMDTAIEMMRDVVAKNKDSKKNRDQALSRIVQIYAKQSNWDKVIEEGKAYLAGYNKDRTKVQQLMAKAYDEKKMYAECIATNMGLFASNTANWAVSVPAIGRATELMWDHGTAKDGKSKQQVAYEVAGKYINSSREAFDKNKDEMPDEVRTAWQDIDRRVQKWEGSGTIQTFEDMKKAQQ
ncbi:tetratricopeptide repeat protein [Rubritalea tangerina]|uniref:Tetratricopeptide repeat protein n=1 Tax=Rubritalea tangerina TaxID=430798 RepID=A0ABW4ZAK2_9BACT